MSAIQSCFEAQQRALFPRIEDLPCLFCVDRYPGALLPMLWLKDENQTAFKRRKGKAFETIKKRLRRQVSQLGFCYADAFL
jgi:hypothetical protein